MVTESISEILIVDDNPATLRMLSQLLTQQDYKVRAVLDGTQALAILDSNPPDLILLDLMMPGMDGYEVCQKVKAHPEGRHIPVIFVSALGSAQDKVRAFQAGGVDFITKPFQVSEIVARMETHLALRKMQKQQKRDTQQLEASLLEFDKLNNELRQRNEELAAYDRSVSHDLKIPVSYICTTSEWLQRSYTQLSPEQLDHFLGQIATRAYQANNIIDSLLLLAQMDDIELYPVDMYATVKRSIENLHDIVVEREVKINIPDSLPPAIGQTSLLEQVWDNYLSNAIKYGGNPPEISIGADEQDHNSIRYWVRDNGPGIPPEKHPYIFTARTHSETEQMKGHGLGLPIVRRIIHRLGGDVGYENLPEKGCCFYFTLSSVGDDWV
jgi:two-component system sensor histidine kinase/response regulator